MKTNPRRVIMRGKKIRVAILGAAALSAARIADAQVSGTWIGPTSGSWTIGTNWTSNPDFPANGGTATFADVGAQAAVLGGGTLTLSALRFDSVAQVDIATSSFNSSFSFTGP